MKVVILGAGALGSIIGGHLARAGEEVTVIACGQRAAYVRQHGMTLTGLKVCAVSQTLTSLYVIRARPTPRIGIRGKITSHHSSLVRSVWRPGWRVDIYG